MARILVLNGPNLNLLGTREPQIYGYQTLSDIERSLTEQASTAGHTVECLQSNAEHVLIDRIHLGLQDGTAYILINPGGLTHTSVALRDALLGTKIPFIEIHLSNVHAREPFRRHSYLSDVARGVICGMGTIGYRLALQAAIHELEQQPVTAHGH